MKAIIRCGLLYLALTSNAQAVSLGTRVDGSVELLSGLKGDEVLAASNLSLLATGVPVRMEQSSNLNESALGEDPAGSSQGGRP